MGKEKVLIVDDEAKLVKVIKAYLEKEGYSTAEAYDGSEALKVWRREKPDIVVLDIMMPGVDGLEFCRQVRKHSNIPIIFLSARSEEIDKLAGFELGADDYMTKPFSPRELLSRIKSIMRRGEDGGEGPHRPIVAGSLEINKETHVVLAGGREVKFTPTEFAILEVLAANPSRVFSREQLVNEVQGEYFDGYERTVDTHIKNIRKKIDENAEDWCFIETVHRVGYKFEAKKKKRY